MEAIKQQVGAWLKEAHQVRVNNIQRSIELANQALNLSTESGYKPLMAQSLNQLSLYQMISGNYIVSMNSAEQALTYFEELFDEKGMADAKYNIASVYYKTDNFQMGLVLMSEAMKTYRKNDDWANQSRTEKSMGTIYEYIGDRNAAMEAYENAILAAQKANNLNMESNAYNNLSGILLRQGKVDEALEMANQSITMKTKTGDVRGFAFSVYSRGKVYLHKAQYDLAETDFIEAIKIHREMSEMLGLGMALAKLSLLNFKTGKLEPAKQCAEEAALLSKAYNMSLIKFKSNYLLYLIAKKSGHPELALSYLEIYQKEKESVINSQTLKVMENYEMIVRMKTIERETQLQHEKEEIIEKQNRAEQAIKVRQEFLSIMSHEIRTPLHAITSIVSLLDGRLDAENRKLLETLQFASNNLIRIVNNILDFSKLDAGKESLDMLPVGFEQFCKNIRNTYHNLANEKGISLLLNTTPDLAPAYLFDDTKLTQLLANLISNAIKFTDEGHVEISISKLDTTDTHDLVRFSVSDTGEGIPENFLKEIFESFSQIKPFLTKKQEGTGLGLSIAGRLAELYGSSIKVESVPSQGSVFWFDLKLERALLPAQGKTQKLFRLAGKHALIAEDNRINAMIMLKLLGKMGITADHALDGSLAYDFAQSKKYDFILMDIHMPVMNGLESAKFIRSAAASKNSDTPLFAVTADITVAGNPDYCPWFSGFLSKPLETEKMHEVLLKAL